MFTVLCNKCFWPKTVENKNKFYFSRCGHIYCEQCVPTGPCHLCNQPYVSRVVDANMSKAMAVYFESLDSSFRRFQKIVQFQTMQDTLFAQHWINFMPAQIQESKRRLDGMTRIDAHINEKIEHETRRIEKLKAYLSYKKYGAREPHQRHQRLARGRSPSSAYSNQYATSLNEYQRPKTPTLSSVSGATSSSANCTRSSNLSKQSDTFMEHQRNKFTI